MKGEWHMASKINFKNLNSLVIDEMEIKGIVW